MSVKYKVLPRKNPQDLLAPEKFYAAALADGTVDFDRNLCIAPIFLTNH